MKKEYKRICNFCGTAFIANDARKVFCSKRCKDIHSKIKRGIKCNESVIPYKKACVICEKEFETFRETDRTCSVECSKKLHSGRPRVRKSLHTADEYKKIVKERAQRRAEEKAKEKEIYKTEHNVERECVECGSLFYCLDTETRKTCSHECSKKLRNRRKDNRIPKRQNIEAISLKRLYKRDNGICYMCGRKCNFNDWNISAKGNKYPGNTYPEIEHVIPISKGGMNSWDNVRLACHKCNHEKADGIIEIKPMPYDFAVSQRYETTKKKTAQYTLDGRLVKIWDSTAQIKRELGLSDKVIQNACRKDNNGKKRRTGNAYGFHWEYVAI